MGAASSVTRRETAIVVRWPDMIMAAPASKRGHAAQPPV
jgi:hypothetical protein